MEPWLGAITDNLEALHMDDESTHGSVEYILERVPLQFKSLNYIRGRSFQQSLILIDECQNLTPHQMKTIITRAGAGSKVVCLGNLAQIDTPYLSDQFGPDLPDRTLQGLPPRRAHHPARGASVGAGRVRRVPHVAPCAGRFAARRLLAAMCRPGPCSNLTHRFTLSAPFTGAEQC